MRLDKNEVFIPAGKPLPEKILDLEASWRQQTPEQMQEFLSSISTAHFFAGGMYARVLTRKAGVGIVGRVHRKEHFYIVAKGKVAVTNGDAEAVVYEAGSVIVSQPGTKRAVVALEDSICMTVHRTDSMDLDEIEKELIEPDANALFDARNQLRIGS